MRIIDEGSHRFGRANANSRDALQQQHRRRMLSPTAQLLFDASQLPIERLDLFQQEIPPQLLRQRGQG